jgi:hypothetical protein
MSLPVFLSDLENIGKHILTGIEKVAPIVAKVAPVVAEVPVVGPILAEVAIIVTNLEQKGTTITSEELATIVETVSAATGLKSAVSGPATASTLSTKKGF